MLSVERESSLLKENRVIERPSALISPFRIIALYTCTKMGDLICEFPAASVSKRLHVQNFSYKNEFDLHENEHAGENTFS